MTYTDIKSIVKWEGEVSRPLGEGQAIRQGASSLTGSYKAGKNKILVLQDKNPSFYIRLLNVRAIMVADDLAVAAHTHTHTHTHTERERNANYLVNSRTGCLKGEVQVQH